MSFLRTAAPTRFIDVLDRVLDKGIVIDAWERVSLAGIDLMTIEARVFVASIQTHLQHDDALQQPSQDVTYVMTRS